MLSPVLAWMGGRSLGATTSPVPSTDAALRLAASMNHRFSLDRNQLAVYNIIMPRVQDPSFAGRLGDAIIARRQWLAISQTDLAERLGVSPTQLGRYEKGADTVSVLMLTRVCTAL